MIDSKLMRVSASSTTQSVATAVAMGLDEASEVRLRAVGAGAVNQAAKALAVARGLVAPKGRDLYVRIGLVDATGVSDETITAVEFTAFVR